MSNSNFEASAPTRGSTKGEVAGSFLLGLIQSFYNLSVLPQGGMALNIDNIDPAGWYPYSMLIDTLHAIEKTFPSSKIVSFRAGINFIGIWYEHGPGKTMIHSGMDWLHANDEGAGYNSVVRGGSRDEIGWCTLRSIDERRGIAVYENVTPLILDFVRGVFYGGCLLFDDMEYVDVVGTTEPYLPNPELHDTVITVNFRLKPSDTGQSLDARIGNLQLGSTLDLSPAEMECLIWRYKGLQRRHALDAEYYKDINVILADAITEGQRIAKELECAKQAAETANLAKSVFLANMSHELRTPLNAILGFSALMQRDATLGDPQHKNLEIINRSGEFLLSLINDILDMAKVEAGRIQLEIVPFDLDALTRDVVDMMRARAAEKNLQLLLERQPEAPRYVRGDEAKLRQVLVNLLGNAIKFTEEGGVTLHVGVVPDPVEPRLRIEVRDSGPGIAAEDCERIFDPFVQVGKVATQKGTGLGLAITRQFVELMGGRIDVTSQLGHGSCFRVELPAMVVAESEVRHHAAEQREIVGLAPNQPEFRVLIVEDQAENALLLRQWLERAGFLTHTAENGVQGVAAFETWRPHFIWMDQRMPEMDGQEATRRIRLLEGGREVKIVALTASVFAEQHAEMLAAGLDDIIHKPVRSATIFRCLAHHLGVRYRYRESTAEHTASPSGTGLNRSAVAALPERLRRDLADASMLLDSKRISELIGQVTQLDAALGNCLRHHADNFEYETIEQAMLDAA
jgi:signal transduction histidine kinase/DNA-binding response OmpR family regulator